VLAPHAPLVTIMVGSQVLNAVLLVPLMFAMIGLGRDRELIGRPGVCCTAPPPPSS
jgi:hypothetical protein